MSSIQKKYKIFFVLLLFFDLLNVKCQVLNDVYLNMYGTSNGYEVWIVDGVKIRNNIFGEFVYGGNPQRYTFDPENEIWIDNSISCSEFKTTLAHELNENYLMKNYGWSYYDAHDSSLSLELSMRNIYDSVCRLHENELPLVSPSDFDSTIEISTLPQYIKLKDIYLLPFDTVNNIVVWIVDGFRIRREIYPDFGFSGNDKAYNFIPSDEIWLDNSMSCSEIKYSIKLEMIERNNLISGMSYDDAYENALSSVTEIRKRDEADSRRKSIIVSYPLYRDKGTGTK